MSMSMCLCVCGMSVSLVGCWQPLSGDKRGLGRDKEGREETEEVARGNVVQRLERMGSSGIYCGIGIG